MWEPEAKSTKLAIIGGVIALTLGIHYGWVIEPIFGHVGWAHAIHGRFCYIPIVVAAAWFGLRGGLAAAAVISVLVLPYVFTSDLQSHGLADELVEIVFYFAIALLAGGLFGRELKSRRKAEEMRLQLERSQKLSLVGQIAAGMAHEIKNPLASIKGAVEILSDDATPAVEREEFKGIVYKEVRRVNASLTDFLEFARPSETKKTEVNLAEIVRSGLKQVGTQAAGNEITIDSEIDDIGTIMADGEKIHQVLLNLLLNAIEVSPSGSTVSVQLSSDPSVQQAVVTITDGGEGIAEEILPKVFEPFFTTKSSGTGLGLAIAEAIIQAHGGTIELRNRAEGGAVATFTLPMIEPGARR